MSSYVISAISRLSSPVVLNYHLAQVLIKPYLDRVYFPDKPRHSKPTPITFYPSIIH